MGRAALLLALSLVGAAGCAALGGFRGGPDPRAQLVEGVAAVQAQQYLRARGLLEPLFYQRYSEPVGQQAMLVLIASEMDNRNPDRRLWAAAEMAGRLINLPGAEPWAVPVAETYYVLAMELGAAEERIAEAESRAEMYRRLPATTQESVPARVSRITAERDQARRRAEQAEQQLAARERELRETRQELERIRRTIRP
jgi:DNA repair exonuclease SbcCD ATPase subunit